MTVKLTDLNGDPVPVENPNCIPLTYVGADVNVGADLRHVDTPLTLPYRLELPDGLRGILSGTGRLILKNPHCVNKSLGGLVVPDGYQYIDKSGPITLALMSLKTIGQVPVRTGDVVAELRFESVPAVKVNAKVGRPRKTEAA